VTLCRVEEGISEADDEETEGSWRWGSKAEEKRRTGRRPFRFFPAPFPSPTVRRLARYSLLLLCVLLLGDPPHCRLRNRLSRCVRRSILNDTRSRSSFRRLRHSLLRSHSCDSSANRVETVEGVARGGGRETGWISVASAGAGFATVLQRGGGS
jgi:hypothetical protein